MKVPIYDVKLVRARKPLTLAESVVGDASGAARVLHALTASADREQFVCLFVNARHEITGVHVAAIGGQSVIGAIDVRPILRAALAACAAAMIVGHNHPSGDPRPSEQDRTATQGLCKAAAVVGIPVLDHVIVTRDPNRSYSFLSHGVMPQGEES